MSFIYENQPAGEHRHILGSSQGSIHQSYSTFAQDKDMSKNEYKDKHHFTIQAGENTLELYAYKRCWKRTIASTILSICTLFIFRLIQYWYVTLYVKCRAVRCNHTEADFIFVVDENQVSGFRPVRHAIATKDNPLIMNNGKGQYGNVDNYRSFTFRKQKYIWSYGEWISPAVIDQSNPVSAYTDSNLDYGLSAQEVLGRHILYGKNLIDVKLKPILVLLFTEVLSPFYIFQVFSVIVWFTDDYEFYASIIVFMTVVSIILDVWQTRSQEKRLRNMVESVSHVEVIRDGVVIQTMSDALVPGDILLIPAKESILPCDAVLMNGTVIVNESMLTGESVPITKVAMTGTDEGSFDVTFSYEKHSKHILFCGTQVLQTRFYGGGQVKAVVLRTGYSTLKGQLVRSIMYPKPVDFRLTRDLLKFVIFLSCIALCGFAYTIAIMIIRNSSVKKIILRSLDIITVVVPPALPAAMSVGIINANSRLKKKQIFCISPTTINTCGAIDVVCFDKTGTLTEDGLDFQTLRAVDNSSGQIKFGSEQRKLDPAELPDKGELVVAFATCHSITKIEGKLHGDPLDLILFQQTGWALQETQEKEGTGRERERELFDNVEPTVVIPPETHRMYHPTNQEYSIIRQFTFSSELQRMSVIVANPTDGSGHDMTLYCKGSPEKIMTLCDSTTMPIDYLEQVDKYTKNGYRLIALAKKRLDMNFAKAAKIGRDKVETDLDFMGLVILENRVKKVTRATIVELNRANIRTVMVTGDNLLTALSVARECGIIRESKKSYLVEHDAENTGADGRPNLFVKEDSTGTDLTVAEFICGVKSLSGSRYQLAISGPTFAVISTHYPELLDSLVAFCDVFARMAPDQKQQLVNHLQMIDYTVAMCGDGANDCAALKAAHAGISLSEAEASIAAPFTSNIADIRCVPTVIREGRAALVTSFSVFKYMAAYSLTQFSSIMLLYWISTNLTDFQFLYIDMLLITLVALFFGNTPASDRLHQSPPPTRLLSWSSVLSIIGQLFIMGVFQAIMFIATTQQTWFTPYAVPYGDDGAENKRSMQGTAVFCGSCFQYITLAFVYNAGPPHRKTMLTNMWLCITLVAITAISLYVVLWPSNWIISFLEFDPIPDFNYRVWLVLLSCICCAISWIFQRVFIDSDYLWTRCGIDPCWQRSDESENRTYRRLHERYQEAPDFLLDIAKFVHRPSEVRKLTETVNELLVPTENYRF